MNEWERGITREGKRGTIPQPPNHHGRADSQCGVSKRPNNVTSTFFNTVHLLRKDLRFEHGDPKLAYSYCPGCHLTSLSLWQWHGPQNSGLRNYIKILIFAKQFLCPRQSGTHGTCHDCHTLDTPLPKIHPMA